MLLLMGAQQIHGLTSVKSEHTLGARLDIAARCVALLAFPLGVALGRGGTGALPMMRAVDALAARLQGRDPRDTTRLRIDAPAEQLDPVVDALDGLFQRMGDALASERRFVSVAAHELRIPLAGMRAQAQIALAADDPVQSRTALSLLMEGVDRSAALVEQLLDLAQAEALSGTIHLPRQGVALASAFDAVMIDLGAMADRKEGAISTRFEAPKVDGLHFGVHLILRNLLANAIAYSPVGGRIHVASEVRGADTVLSVDDAGPGIAPQDRERAFQRFDRIGKTGPEGVGLGLPIVALAAGAQGASVRLLDSPLGGLRVEVCFPTTVDRDG
ncbi:MAG: ATP-binding protein [Pseudomonadota bacterium]|nr:ATP-binding protein [Pseudomonadota bacterium]